MSEQRNNLGTYAIKNSKDLELLAKMIWAKKTGDIYYKSPLIRDEDKQ